jgi:formamidopyrimidine-DNA glycosylase
MPELPEVEMYRRYLSETALNQKVSNIDVLHPKVVGGKGALLNQLVGDQFTSSKRWGKNLFIQTGKNQTLFMHFGMTGNLEYYNSSLEPPKYSRVVFGFDNNYNLAYVSKRMFGRLGMVSDIESYVSDKSLGEDALEISEQDFTKALAAKNKNIKGALLDQGVSAGVGNWIADEILFQSRIYPTTHARNLSQQQLQTVYEKMQEIMRVAIEVDAVRADLPPHYITHYGRKTPTVQCPKCKSRIEKFEVGGRGTYACGQCQQEF